MNNEIYHMNTVEHHMTTNNEHHVKPAYLHILTDRMDIPYSKILKIFTKCAHPIPNHPTYILAKNCEINHANFEVK